MTASDQAIGWLLDSDPSIRWQVMRDLLGYPREEWEAERAKVESEGWGARLLELEDEDGSWAGGAHFPSDFEWGGDEPGQAWTSTSHSLAQLRLFGLVPDTDRVRRMVERDMSIQLTGRLFVFPPWLVALVVGFSVAVTVGAAYYPARRASRIDPVAALRHD